MEFSSDGFWQMILVLKKKHSELGIPILVTCCSGSVLNLRSVFHQPEHHLNLDSSIMTRQFSCFLLNSRLGIPNIPDHDKMFLSSHMNMGFMDLSIVNISPDPHELL
jgi:hypothetical protein